ncbi:sensor domain-containing protein [Mycobacterium sp. NPDC050853]|uniref:sensor domain-containing protein n=1 Tax=Mycobacteriaceae TaxID=1762 RepID=UPI0015DE9BB1|nr:sensor domain-containing protein [Mycobacteroides sp. LB1]
MRWAPGVFLSIAVLASGCTHPVGGTAAAPQGTKPFYSKVQPEQRIMAKKLLTAEEIGEVTGIPRLEQVVPIETVLANGNIVSDCAFGATLATRQQYLSFTAARVQTATKVADGVREYTISNALVVFESVANAQQQFEQFSSRMQRCDGVRGDLNTATGSESWHIQVIHAGDDEVNWTRKNDSGKWSCRLIARPRANYIASVMYCRLVDADDKAEQVISRLLDKLAG